MTRHDVVIIKDSHRGLLYEDGVFREVLPAGRHRIARPSTSWLARLGLVRMLPVSEVVLIDVRRTDRTVPVPDLLTADRATISASFAIEFRVVDPRAATGEVRHPGEMLVGGVQTAARRLLRGMTLEEIMAARDEIGEELLMIVADSASAYGIEVSGVDFKDLILPDEFRESMNRAVYARFLRRALPLEGWGEEEEETQTAEVGSGTCVALTDRDEPRLILPLANEEAGASPFAGDLAEATSLRYLAASE